MLAKNASGGVRAMRIALAVCTLVTALAAVMSSGVYHEDDLEHYLYARWWPQEPAYLLDAWGRPGFTLLHAPLAVLGSAETGWMLCRLLSVGLTAATAWLAYRLADGLRIKHAWLAIPLLYFQPLLTRLSLTTLTETPCAFYLAAASWLLWRGRCSASAAVLALAPMTRQESIILLPLWAWVMYRRGASWPAYPLLGWALAAHNLLAGVLLNEWPIAAFLAPAGSTQYGRGTPLTYIPHLMVASGPVVAGLALLGARRVVRRGGGFIAAGAVLWMLVQTVVYMRGAYSSGGYPRFLVPMAPWLAVLAAAGASELFVRRGWIRQRALVVLMAACVGLGLLTVLEFAIRTPELSPRWMPTFQMLYRLGLPAGVVLTGLCWLGWPGRLSGGAGRAARGVLAGVCGVALLAGAVAAVRPMQLRSEHLHLRAAAEWLQADPRPERTWLVLNCWIYYWSDRVKPRVPRPGVARMASAEPGTLLIWDAKFGSEPERGLTWPLPAEQPGWQVRWRAGAERSLPAVAILEKSDGWADHQPAEPRERADSVLD